MTITSTTDSTSSNSSEPELCGCGCLQPLNGHRYRKRGTYTGFLTRCADRERRREDRGSYQPDGSVRGKGQPRSEYSAATVRKALSTGYAPKCLTMASGEATLSRKGIGTYVTTSYGPAMRQVASTSAKGTVNSKWQGTASNKHGARPQKGQQDCTACQAGAHGKEHVHSLHDKPQERSAHLEVTPAKRDHITRNFQTMWSIPLHVPAAPAPRHMLKRCDLKVERGCEVEAPSDLRVKYDPQVVNSTVIQARLAGFESYEDLHGVA